MDIVEKNVIEVLMRLAREAKEHNTNKYEYAVRAFAISHLLFQIEKDFSTEFMLSMIHKTSQQLGRSLSPLDYKIVKKLLDHGGKITKVHSVFNYTVNK